MDEQRSSARASVIRDAVIFTPLFLAVIAGWTATLVGVLAEGDRGIIALVILGLMAVLLGFQSIQALRDLLTEPKVTRGEIARKWSRTELLVVPGHYIYVNNVVFKLPALLYEQLENGDTVAITYYPHTNTVVAVSKESGIPSATTH